MSAQQTPRPTLTGDRVVLRAPRLEDVDARLALGSSPEMLRLFGGDPRQHRPLTRDAAQSWFDALMQDTRSWVIEADGKMIGTVRLHSVNHADRRAMLAIAILDESLLARGLGTEAMRLLAAYAFDVMGLHRLSLRVLAFNDRAIAAYRKVGFVEEGREREAALIGDDWHDDLIMGLLASEFAPEGER